MCYNVRPFSDDIPFMSGECIFFMFLHLQYVCYIKPEVGTIEVVMRNRPDERGGQGGPAPRGPGVWGAREESKNTVNK